MLYRKLQNPVSPSDDDSKVWNPKSFIKVNGQPSATRENNMAALLGHMGFWNASLAMISDKWEEAMRTTPTGEAIVMTICCSFLSMTTVVENAFVIFAVWKDPLKTLRSSPTNFILLEMACADLFVGLVFAPSATLLYLRLATKTHAWNSLFVVILFSHLFLIVSVYHVLLLTIDRYFALAKPLQYRATVTKRRVAIGSLAIWLVWFCYGVLSVTLQGGVFVLWFILVLMIWLSSEGSTFMYVVTLRNLIKHCKTGINANNPQSNQFLLCQREKKVFVVILSVALAFYFCFVPWIVGQLIFLFCQACHVNYRALTICYHMEVLLLLVNSALNPLLYAWRFSRFQATFKYIWRKCCCQNIPRRSKTINITNERQTHDTKLWQFSKILLSARLACSVGGKRISACKKHVTNFLYITRLIIWRLFTDMQCVCETWLKCCPIYHLGTNGDVRPVPETDTQEEKINLILTPQCIKRFSKVSS